MLRFVLLALAFTESPFAWPAGLGRREEEVGLPGSALDASGQVMNDGKQAFPWDGQEL